MILMIVEPEACGGRRRIGTNFDQDDLGVIAEVIVSESFVSRFEGNSTQTSVSATRTPLICDYITDMEKSGLVVSMFTCGAFFGACFAGISGDYLGRRRTISLGCLLFCLGGALQTGAQSLAYLWSGRFFAGFG